MKSKTHIFIVHMKTLILIFVLCLFLLFLILFFVYSKKNENVETMSIAKQGIFSPGTYQGSLLINQQHIPIQVNVDTNGPTSVSIPTDHYTITNQYPLIEASLKDISSQLASGVPLEKLQSAQNNYYTFQVLKDAISQILEQAAP